MDKTPLQQAIDDLNTEISRCKCDNEYEVGRSQALEAAKFILESLLPKEREFVEKVFHAGAEAFDDALIMTGVRQFDNARFKRSENEFFNQLYPKS